MLDIVDNIYIAARLRVNRVISELKKEERGVSNFVATIVLILIVVLLCAVFYEAIGEWFKDMWERITGQTDPMQKIELPT